MATYEDRRLWPGTVPPVAGTPERRPGWVRRTTTVDMDRPDGLGGPLQLRGRGRDLCTTADGAVVVGEAVTRVEVAYALDRTVTAVEASPATEGLERLIGVRAGSGFRRLLAEVAPELTRSGSLVHLLLDEVSPTVLISGSAVIRSGAPPISTAPAGSAAANAPVDICAGWQAGGAMFDALAETGIPLLGWGPPAPALDTEDPLAWHERNPLAAGAMRRSRRIDLGPVTTTRGGAVGVDVLFRDSYGEADGTETVVHEYQLRATVDPVSWTFTAAEAVPGPLPAPECPTAAASAGRLVGRPVTEVRDQVRRELVGTSTCTHLNDVLRSLADLGVLWALRR